MKGRFDPAECRSAKIVGEPYALIGHVRFDEGEVLVNCLFINSWVPTYSTLE